MSCAHFQLTIHLHAIFRRRVSAFINSIFLYLYKVSIVIYHFWCKEHMRIYCIFISRWPNFNLFFNFASSMVCLLDER
ncbi:hypothetical protein BKA69DRAFT_815673 [Paraphysoderma sedebokerense]|nr:hypothetical protein BKA69DRAFT_815673 [Paraphysoderma sedebokerense]